MKEREKEIKYLLYLKSELIRKTKREMHNLRMELEELNKQKTMRRKKDGNWRVWMERYTYNTRQNK